MAIRSHCWRIGGHQSRSSQQVSGCAPSFLNNGWQSETGNTGGRCWKFLLYKECFTKKGITAIVSDYCATSKWVLSEQVVSMAMFRYPPIEQSFKGLHSAMWDPWTHSPVSNISKGLRLYDSMRGSHCIMLQVSQSDLRWQSALNSNSSWTSLRAGASIPLAYTICHSLHFL